MAAYVPTDAERERFAHYTVEVREANVSKVQLVIDHGKVMRLHTVVQRIPSERKFLVLHLIGRTDDERAWGEMYAATLTRGGWAIFGGWGNSRRPDGTPTKQQRIGQYASDPLLQLELEQIIDNTTEVNA